MKSSEGEITGRPRGFTYLEIQVALVVFGITLTGLGAIAAAQLRIMQALERRVHCQVPQGASLSFVRLDGVLGVSADVTNPVLLSAERWARQLGAGAALVEVAVRPGSPATVITSPSPLQAPSPPFAERNLVTIAEYPAVGDPAQIRATVTPITSEP